MIHIKRRPDGFWAVKNRSRTVAAYPTEAAARPHYDRLVAERVARQRRHASLRECATPRCVQRINDARSEAGVVFCIECERKMLRAKEPTVEDRIAELEHRLAELEHRLAELEK